MSTRDIARKIVPFPLRVELVRLFAMPGWIAEHRQFRLERRIERFEEALAGHETPLNRDGRSGPLQAGKEHNIRLAATRLDGLVLEPGQTFSYHHAVGRPSRLRGFRKGLELQGGEPSSGIGGGCCAVSNLLYLIAIRAGLEIVERHRHQLDLFPDHNRTVPFGCGATIFFPNRDLKFRNPHSVPVQIALDIKGGELKGMILAPAQLDIRFEIVECDHRFEKQGDAWIRENRIIRQTWRGDDLLKEEEVAHNLGRCLYDPEAAGG